MTTRDTSQRIARYMPDVKGFDLPLSYILANPRTKYRFPVPITEEYDNADLFPSTASIHTWLWASSSKKSGQPWHALLKLVNNNYVYLTATCENHFDEPTACIKVMCSTSLENLIKYAMDDDAYALYYKKTMPMPKPRPASEDSDNE